MTTLSPDIAEIRRSVAIFLQPGQVVEMRCPKTDGDGTISGYFSDSEKLVSAAARVSGRGPGVYVTLNQLPVTLLGSDGNRWKAQAVNTTKNAEVISRNWLLLDFDPPRASGISSTDAEHEISIATARHAAQILQEQGWPEGDPRGLGKRRSPALLDRTPRRH